ncbi:MAG: hypothetical protein QXL86_03470 [Candidatus Aenigmatarchaeota archaeon]
MVKRYCGWPKNFLDLEVVLSPEFTPKKLREGDEDYLYIESENIRAKFYSRSCEYEVGNHLTDEEKGLERFIKKQYKWKIKPELIIGGAMLTLAILGYFLLK